LKGKPLPKSPNDLLQHNCITLRLPTSGGIYAWELKKGSREVQVRVDGQCTFNGAYQMINCALSGCGLAFVPDDLVADHVRAGRLKYVLEDWFPMFPGFHIYYPSRRHPSRALAIVVEALRFRS
jgi:DNA-binding transcriptional LysR family regulator